MVPGVKKDQVHTFVEIPKIISLQLYIKLDIIKQFVTFAPKFPGLLVLTGNLEDGDLMTLR